MFVCGKYNLVHEFFWKVQKSSIPNALTYKGILENCASLLVSQNHYNNDFLLCTVLVNTLWREGKTDEAVLAVQDMEKRGVVGSAALYYDLARCLCTAGRCQEALMQVFLFAQVFIYSLPSCSLASIRTCTRTSTAEGEYIFVCACTCVQYGSLDHALT